MKHFFLVVSLLLVFQGAMAFQGPVQDSLNVANKKEIRHTLSLNYGVGFITSKVYDEYARRQYSWRHGKDLHAEYRFVVGRNMGLGLMWNYSYTDYKTTGIDLTYIAPEFIMQGERKHWLFSMTAGLGYAKYDDGIKSDTGFGMHYSVGAEYLITRHIGVGTDLLVVNTNFGKSDSEYYAADVINRLSLLIGLRFHL